MSTIRLCIVIESLATLLVSLKIKMVLHSLPHLCLVTLNGGAIVYSHLSLCLNLKVLDTMCCCVVCVECYVAVDDEEELVSPESMKSSSHLDSFDEVYKTYELTDFDRLLTRSISRTGE